MAIPSALTLESRGTNFKSSGTIYAKILPLGERPKGTIMRALAKCISLQVAGSIVKVHILNALIILRFTSISSLFNSHYLEMNCT